MITIYSKTNCPACVVAKDALKKNGIMFQEINIDHNQEAKMFLVESGFRQVPQLFKNNKSVKLEDILS